MTLTEIGRNAKEVAGILNTLGSLQKNQGLKAVAKSLLDGETEILDANRRDVEKAVDGGMSPGLVDRLALNPSRIKGMADGLLQVASLEDPVGEVISMKNRPNGLIIGQKRVPMGVIGIIYEARPNVTADAFGLCFKTGNAVILKGGSDALESNKAIVERIQKGLQSVGLPAGAVQLIEDTNRETTKEFMKMNDYVDVLIPRGGAGLIRTVVENSTIPVIETGTGNCHIFVDESADFTMALDIIYNAKTQRIGVCNACESLVVHRAIAEQFLPLLKERLGKGEESPRLHAQTWKGEESPRLHAQTWKGEESPRLHAQTWKGEESPRLHEQAWKGVEIRGDEASCAMVDGLVPATEEDWGREYLDYILSLKLVDSIEEAISHINRYNTGHSEAIITSDYSHAQKFLNEIDAAAVYVNASTRFTDGEEFGFGAEIGISTQKLHARGPMGLKELTSTKYIIYGNGQVRP